ncbi:PLP-dependent aminotransferase family protein [Pseudomonas fluorescens]|jgi:DNA-binding transcriptional MocR family regulator|uniref:DNA-binding transcriptional regulator, MocR family, contains an aminotransferase domain n=2 Tax=Pseudomonas fluorescens TaxID=294 RepID=A0ABY1TG51_PSEFL|nr:MULTISPECIES: PLP-dependent aminotransferase family protein [Pseudomonas]MBK5544492.1 PLP-dependent aminotransferase family protein [Pseudomonas sp. TH04]MCI4605740.1 PLP-dependent aminotransferase family protein [Pseudomonas fluorescens]MDD5442417.1 PLP-dependent aminotransferase family protein [Pseudomonas fluorescens]NNB70117.1 PLP-dependent aminotransferase family protein [Pseudomonas fluorescens]OEC72313.1 GntR family transcriptional regulator [Pseudomonas sp. AP19]
MDLGIDRQALVPVVQQIVSAVAQWIRQSGASPGTRLPSIRQVALDNLLSQSSVVEAFERMVAQGLLASRHGSGFVVAQPPVSLERQWYEGAELTWGAFVEGPLGELKLGCGWLPDAWRESDDLCYALREISRTDTAGLFNYSTPLGLPALREQLLKRLTQIKVATHLDCILTTHGAGHAQDLLIRTLLKAGDTVVVETPGYANLYRQLERHGVTLLEVPRTVGGPDIPVLETLLQRHRPRCLFINCLYHNPTGTSLCRAIAERLLQLARSEDFLIIEEDVYGDLQHASCTRLSALPHDGRVIYVSSFSKTLSSALRVGYVSAGAAIIAQMASLKTLTGIGTSRFAEAVVATLLTNGTYRKWVQRLRKRLNTQMAATLQVLEDEEWEVFAVPAGGMFVWARPGIGDRSRLQACARRLGVLLSPGALFNPKGEASDWLRINVAYADDQRALALFRAMGPAGSTSTILKTTSM